MLPGPLDPSLAGAYDGAEDKPRQRGTYHFTSINFPSSSE